MSYRNGFTPKNEYDSLTIYLQQVGQPPALSHDEEQALAARMQLGDSEAREKLIVTHLRVAVGIAVRYQGRGLPLEDLIAEANIGLMRAVDHFNWKLGFRLESYASQAIRRAIWHALTCQALVIRVPKSAALRWRQICAGAQQLRFLLGREPTSHEIAYATGLTIDRVRHIEHMVHQPLSLDASLSEDGSDSLADTVEDRNAKRPDASMATELLRETLAFALATLSPTERQVLELRFGLGDGKTHSLGEIGQHYGVTREAIRQCEAKALKRLRHNSRKHLFLEVLDRG